MKYKLNYNLIGQVNNIQRDDGVLIPLDINNMDYHDFLTWNIAQEIPLDLNSVCLYTAPIESPREKQQRLIMQTAQVYPALTSTEKTLVNTYSRNMLLMFDGLVDDTKATFPNVPPILEIAWTKIGLTTDVTKQKIIVDK